MFGLCCFIPLPNAYYLVFTYAPIFALGISLVDFYKNRNWLDSLLPIFLLALIEVKFGILIFILLFISCSAIFYLNNDIKPLVFLGNISYSLYLTHSLVLIVFLGVGKRLNVNFEHFQLFWLFVEILLALLFAYCFYLVIEKPSISLSKRIFYKKPKD